LINVPDRLLCISLIREAAQSGCRLEQACNELGLSLRTFQRWVGNGDAVLADGRTMTGRAPPRNKLSEAERQQILEVANCAEFASLPPSQIVPSLADRGVYVASESSFYRVLRSASQQHHRGRARKPSARVVTSHCATAPNQVWSWDITWMPAAVKGQYYYWYMMLDVFSRKIVAHEVHEAESAELAAFLMRRASLAEGLAGRPLVLHSDSRHHTQYFEIMGNRAIYHDGWIASARHGLPWVLVGKTGNFDQDKWELYDLRSDFTQAHDLAAQDPAKLKEMQKLFDTEARKYNVYPLDDRFAERGHVADRPSVTRGMTEFTYYPGTVRVPEGSAPNVKARSHTITAVFDTPATGKINGVIVAQGGSAGYTLFVKDGRLMYENNFFGRERDLLQAKDVLPAGIVTATFDYTQEDKTFGGGGTGRLLFNGNEVASGKFAHVVPIRYSATETFDIGEDSGEAVSNQYEGPFPFTGKLDHVTIKLGTSMLSKKETAQRDRASQGILQAHE
jgi:transposase InsO family protein